MNNQTSNNKLIELIRGEIERCNGYINFAKFMQLALYAPDLGYYSSNIEKIGKDGDFITAPELSPIFAMCLANQCQQILEHINGGNIIEFGAGNGTLAADLLIELERNNVVPANYYILELSPYLAARQQRTLQKKCPQLLECVQWLTSLPNTDWQGVIIANEVLDAMPVHLFAINDDAIEEIHVGVKHNKLVLQGLTSSIHKINQRVTNIKQNFLPDCSHYQSEINLLAEAWIQQVTEKMRKGVAILIDYGFPRHEYYHPSRNTGTLMCHHQHKTHHDPLINIGQQDLTSHIDFTAIAQSAQQANLSIAGFCNQATFLINTGLDKYAQQLYINQKQTLKTNTAIKMLTLPSEMGEIFKVLAISKNYSPPLLGFARRNKQHTL